MLVSHRKKFIYTKTKKTAGTSVESYFERYCMPEGAWSFSHAREETVTDAGIIGFRGSQSGNKIFWHHMPAEEIRRLVGEDVWADYFKFCVIRNPFDKLVSAFYFFARHGLGEGLNEDPGTRKEFLIESFRTWLKEGDVLTDRETYTLDNNLCMDYVIRYEDLKEGLRHVCNHLGLPFVPKEIPLLKAGVRDRGIPLKEYYDDQCLVIVEEAYDFELAAFGYQRPK